MHAARQAGSSSEQIGDAIGITGEEARERFASAFARQETVCPGAESMYRSAL